MKSSATLSFNLWKKAHIFSFSDQPPWVFAQCQIQAAFNVSQINRCVIDQLTSGDTLETCICSTELCNYAKRTSPMFSLILIVLFMFALM